MAEIGERAERGQQAHQERLAQAVDPRRRNEVDRQRTVLSRIGRREVERVRHLMGVIQGHCEEVGRDPTEITKTKLGTLAIGETREQADAKLQWMRDRGVSEERIAAVVIAGDPDEVTEQVRAFLEAGLDGLIVNMPDVQDLDSVALAGETLARAIG